MHDDSQNIVETERLLPVISILNAYSLNTAPNSASRVIDAMVAKVSADGHPGILSYEMFHSGAQDKVLGLFRYQDADAWIGHHELIKDWQEFAQLRETLTLTSIRFLGTIPPEIHAWLVQANFDTSIIEECPPIARYVK